MSNESSSGWRPTASRPALERRAALLGRARKFFADRGVLEVDTPVVVNSTVTDVNIHSARVTFADAGDASRPAPSFFLHTSPEYAMKRLLAAGSGDIYQICHVVRGLERGHQHNAEFTLIEWYRVGYSLDALMSEVAELVVALLEGAANLSQSERLSYREAFLRALKLDPFSASVSELAGAAARMVGFAPYDAGAANSGGASSGAVNPRPHDRRDELLELLMGACVGPQLGHHGLTFVHGYPASQAALARLDPHDARAALRFELYGRGIELANGFQELANAAEQRVRFERDNAERQRLGLPAIALDERMLAALEHGLPDCAGVAVGFDRVLMLATGADRIDEVMAFPIERA